MHYYKGSIAPVWFHNFNKSTIFSDSIIYSSVNDFFSFDTTTDIASVKILKNVHNTCTTKKFFFKLNFTKFAFHQHLSVIMTTKIPCSLFLMLTVHWDIEFCFRSHKSAEKKSSIQCEQITSAL